MLRVAKIVIQISMLAFALPGQVQSPRAEPPETPVLVELFTSEGCSSCPPADTFLRNLDATQPLAGAHFIVLSEHVDYWDDLGWKDPYSLHAVTARQEAYAQRLGTDGPYTPQMVVDGKFEFVGSDRKQATQVFNKVSRAAKVEVRIGILQTGPGFVQVQVETGPVEADADIYVALAQEHAESSVQRGENGGKQLQHVAVVREFSKIGSVRRSHSYAQRTRISAQGSALPLRLVAFVQARGQGAILGAAAARIERY